MSHPDFTAVHRMLGRVSAWSVFFLSVIYAVTATLGLIALESPRDPIGDPYFTIMELLIILLAPLMVIAMVAVHGYAPREVRACSLSALIFMVCMAVITSSLHFVVLTVSRPLAAASLASASLLFSFEWPSVVYALDILAWDGFFALSMLLAAAVFRDAGLEKAVRYLMIVSGVLSLVGLLGVPLAMLEVDYWLHVRNIGIVGYALVAPIAFLLLGMLFGRTEPAAD